MVASLLLLLALATAHAAPSGSGVTPGTRASAAQAPAASVAPVQGVPDAGGKAGALLASAPVRVDHVVLLDTAGAMRDVAQALLEPLARYVEALPAGDGVAIVAFHTRAMEVLPITIVTDADRATIAARIRVLELPSANSVDLGAGLDALARALRGRGPAARVAYVVSPFCHDPSLNSDWDAGGRGCRAVRGTERLNAAFKAAASTPFSVYLVGAPNGSRAPEVAGRAVATQTTAPGWPVLIDAPAVEFFRAQTQALPDARAVPVLRAEAASAGLALSIDAQDGGSATLRISSDAPHLQFRATFLEITGAAAPTGEVALSPAAEVPVALDVPPPPFSVLPRSDRVPVTVRVRAALAPLQAEALAAVGIASSPRPTEAEATVIVPRVWGPSTATAVAGGVGVAALGAAGLVVARRRRPHPLGGAFSYRRHGQTARQSLDVAERSEVAFVVDRDGTLRVGTGEEDGAMFLLRAHRTHRGPAWEADILKPGIEMNGKRVRPGLCPVVPGATSFRFGDHRVFWE